MIKRLFEKNNKFFLIIFFIYIIISVYVFFLVPVYYDTTHFSDEVKEDVCVLKAGEEGVYSYYAESGFCSLSLRLSGYNDATFDVSVYNADNILISEMNADSSESIYNPDYHSYEINIFEEPVSYGSGLYTIRIKNNSDANALSFMTLRSHPQSLSLHSFGKSYIGRIIALFCIAVSGIYLFYILFIADLINFSPERFFLISSIILSFVYIILYLPWDCPDSESHYPAIYRLSNILLGEGDDPEWMVSQKDESIMTEFTHRSSIGVGAYDRVISKMINMGEDHYIENDVDQRRMAFYSLISYLPQTLGMCIGRSLDLGGMAGIYIGRLLMNILYIFICYRSISRAPIFKWVFSFISLLPFPLLYASSISYDAMLLVFSLLYIANILKYSYDKNDKTLFELTVCCFFFGSIKAGAGLILLLMIFACFSKNNIYKVFIPVLTGLLSLALFNYIIPQNGYFQFGGVDEGYLRVDYMLYHPLKYLIMSIRAYLMNAWELLSSEIFYRQNHFIVGVPASMLELITFGKPVSFKVIAYVIAPSVISFVYYILLLDSVYDEDIMELKKRSALVFIIICFLLYMLLTPAMLLSFTHEGSEYIIGLQGRYYLIILPVSLVIVKMIINMIKKIFPNIRLWGALRLKNDFIKKCFSVLSVFSVLYGVIYNLTL